MYHSLLYVVERNVKRQLDNDFVRCGLCFLFYRTTCNLVKYAWLHSHADKVSFPVLLLTNSVIVDLLLNISEHSLINEGANKIIPT